MTISLYSTARGTFVPMLGSLALVLGRGAEHAAAKKLDAAELLRARLAPDMFTLTQQVQLACHHALDAVARLGGGEVKAAEPLDETMTAVRARIAATVERVERTPATAFANAEERVIVIPLSPEARVEMTGEQYLRDWLLPHFYFHVVTAYDILRHNGVEIGKKDYGSGVGRYIKMTGA